MNIALLIGRLFLGLSLSAHGAQKLFGAFDGPGLKGTEEMTRSLGFRPAKLWAIALALSETLAGLFTALGLFFPYAPAAIIPVMIVAGVTVHASNGFFAQDGGVELTVSYVVFSLMLAVTGPGALALESSPYGPALSWGVVFLGFVLGLATLALRKEPGQQED